MTYKNPLPLEPEIFRDALFETMVEDLPIIIFERIKEQIKGKIYYTKGLMGGEDEDH